VRPLRAKPGLQKITLFGLALLGALCLAELALRLFAPLHLADEPTAYVYDAELGFRLRESHYSLRTTDFLQEIRTNRRGTANFQEDFSRFPSLVFAVGDSFTQGTGLPADAAYPFQLDLILNTDARGRYTPRYGVVNLGVAGYGGEQALILLRRTAQRLHPPAVILYLGCENDDADDLLFRSGYRHKHIVEGSPLWGGWVRPLQWLTNDLQIGVRAKVAIDVMRRGRIPGADVPAAGAPAPAAARSGADVRERLAAFAREHNARLVVSWANDTESYGLLQKWAAQRGIPFADWRARVVSVQAAMPALTANNPHSGGHHRAWVNRLIAEEFARQMQAAR